MPSIFFRTEASTRDTGKPPNPLKYLCYYGAGEILAGVFGRRPRAGSFAGARLG